MCSKIFFSCASANVVNQCWLLRESYSKLIPKLVIKIKCKNLTHHLIDLLCTIFSPRNSTVVLVVKIFSWNLHIVLTCNPLRDKNKAFQSMQRYEKKLAMENPATVWVISIHSLFNEISRKRKKKVP